jgi:protein-tyrosine phosphatase
MIDLHCHLLPMVDDGPETLAESIHLAEMAVADGITCAVVTPHVHPGRYRNTRTTIERAVAHFSRTLAERNIPLTIRMGGEIRVCPEILDLIEADEIPFLGQIDAYRIALFEFPHQTIPVGSQQFMSKMIDLKIRPLIAHPERNKMIMDNPDRIRPYVDMGCMLQLTAGAVTGAFGSGAQKTAHYLLENNLAWILATDAHNHEHRPPQLAAGRDAVAALLGARRAEQMTLERPARILGLDPS